MYQRIIKRILDIVISLLALIALSPLLIIITIAIKAEDPGPAFFRQKRVGIHKSYFDIVKFRTMRVETPKDIPTHMLTAPDKWITRVGRVLRTTSLDELPQLHQILQGKMSLIGPRPALWNQEDLIALRDKYGANDIMPGLTGWAQVNGRDTLELEKKARLDGEYARNVSFGFDVRIFALTVVRVFRHSGVVEGGTGAAEEERKA